MHLTRQGSGGGHRRRSLHTHLATLRADHVVTVDGSPVTTPARTLLDVGRTQRFESAVVAIDSALHQGLVTTQELADMQRSMRRWPGIVRASRAIAFADGRSESVGESRTRVQIRHAGLPAPQLQIDLYTPDGEFIGRTDFLFEKQRTVGEFDGMTKYGRLLVSRVPDSLTPERVSQLLVAEKAREDAIRRLPRAVARWIWNDLETHSVGSILSQAFQVGAALPGFVRW